MKTSLRNKAPGKAERKRPTLRVSTGGDKQSTVHIWSSSNHQVKQHYLMYSQAPQIRPVAQNWVVWHKLSYKPGFNPSTVHCFLLNMKTEHLASVLFKHLRLLKVNNLLTWHTGTSTFNSIIWLFLNNYYRTSNNRPDYLTLSPKLLECCNFLKLAIPLFLNYSLRIQNTVLTHLCSPHLPSTPPKNNS